MKVIFILLLGSAVWSDAFTQETSTGIFITISDYKKKDVCQRIFFDRGKKTKVCATLNPIITSKDFVGLTGIQNDPARNKSYFNLILSPQGYDKLRNITKALADTELALVLDDVVIGFIKNRDEIVNRMIQIDGTANSLEVIYLHEQFEKVVKQ